MLQHNLYPDGGFHRCDSQRCPHLKLMWWRSKDRSFGVAQFRYIKTVGETVRYIQAKEVAQNALIQAKEVAQNAFIRSSITSAISFYKNLLNLNHTMTIPLKTLKTLADFVKNAWSRRQKRTVERNFCWQCCSKQKKSNRSVVNSVWDLGDTAAISIGGVYTKPSASKPSHHLLFNNKKGWKDAKSLNHPTLTLNVSIDENDYLMLVITRS